MRATALARWGITCFLLAPLAFLSWLLSPGALVRLLPATPDVVVAVATAWGVLAPIVALLLVVTGAVLNVLAIRRGVRGVDRLASGDWDAPRLPGGPRIILPEGWESEHPTPASRRRVSRRTLGTLLSGALLAWAAVIAWVLTVEHPLALAGGALPLGAVYDAWEPAGLAGFVVAVVVWAVLAVAAAVAVFLLGRMPRAGLDRVLAPQRFVALTAILASALAVAAQPALLTLGIGLVDDLAAATGEPLSGGWSAGSWHVAQWGTAFSTLAILATVPRWSGALRRRVSGNP
ncbi:hypothetical protein GCM10009792_05090 [Microcella alkalica]|uniref:Uncharacterized protein n=1 Tax=Microcella alkalica TaxID=355930 RepID=A0A839E887_9MICO|nr:hypothetical protein [Microcella alkalica]MBA8846632.1 hypothetical protein [Microcella alkalica]